MILDVETRLPGMSVYLLTLKDTWRAVDAIGGTYSAEQKASGYAKEHNQALQAACDLIECLIFKTQMDELEAGLFRMPEAAA